MICENKNKEASGSEIIDRAESCIRALSQRIATTPYGNTRNKLYADLMAMVSYRNSKLSNGRY